jgi:hypothetical protein
MSDKPLFCESRKGIVTFHIVQRVCRLDPNPNLHFVVQEDKFNADPDLKHYLLVPILYLY